MTARGRHRASRSGRGSSLRILFFVAGFLLTGGTAAMAFYVINIVDNNSPATTEAAQLAAATAPTASANDTSGTIAIGWTSVSQPSGAAVQYQVVRSSGPGSPETVCTVGSTTTACQDTGLTAGTTYGYSITAVLDNWQSTSVAAWATTATPTLALTLSTSSPIAGQPVAVQSIAALVDGTVDPTYTGPKAITWGGLASGPLGRSPSYPSDSVTFLNGMATLSGPGSTFTEFGVGSATLTATDGGAVTVVGQAAISVSPAPANSFSLSTPPAQSAGTAFNENVTALDAYGNTAIGLSGPQSIVFGGLSDSPDRNAPDYPESVNFTDGAGTGTVTDFDAETAALTATQGSVTGASGPFTVSAAGAYSFMLPTPSTQTAGTAFDEIIAALDVYGNAASGFEGPQALAFAGPSDSPDGIAPNFPISVDFTDGMGAASLTLPDAEATALTATQGTITGKSGAFTVAAREASSFVLPTPVTQTAGTAFNDTITAVDADGNAADGWSSVTKCISVSGPSASPNATAPEYPPVGTCSPGQSSLVFGTSGQASASITLFNAGTSALTATEGGVTGTSGTFTVSPLVASSFLLATPSAPSVATAFNETVTAADLYGNTATAYAGQQVLTFTGPSDGPDGAAPVYPSSVVFTAGVGTASITLSTAETTMLTATQGTVIGTSTTFTVATAPVGPQGTETSLVLRSLAAHSRVGHRALTFLTQFLAETLS
jgi:hypothetical protein